MIRRESFAKFRSPLPRNKVFDAVEDALRPLGDAVVDDRGLIAIRPRAANANGITAVYFEGDVFQKGDSYTVSITYSISPSAVAWGIFAGGMVAFACGVWVLFTIGLMLLFVGSVFLTVPFLTQGAVAKRVEFALCRVEDLHDGKR